MSSQESPQKQDRVVFTPAAIKWLAVAALGLIGIAIYTIPNMPSSPWSSLKKVVLKESHRKPVPQFEWSGGGKSLKTADLRGKWYLVSFWAYWCLPCLEELPELNDLDQTWNGPEMRVLTINTDDPKGDNFEYAKTFIADNNLIVPVYFDTEARLKSAFGVQEMPKHFLINPNGEIIWEAVGAIKWSSNKVRDSILKLQELPAIQPEGAEEISE